MGRLDYDSSGLLLLTDDGGLAHVLTHPKFGVEKTYRVRVRGRLEPGVVAALRAGLGLDDGRAAPVKLRVLATRRGESELEVTVHEGRNRLVRRLFEAVGHPVEALARTRFGPLALGPLEPGCWRRLRDGEIAALGRLRSDAHA